MTDESLKSLGQALKKLLGLRSLNLHFSEYYYLIFQLILNLRCPKITDIGMDSLSKGLESLGSLKTIHLRFSQYNNKVIQVRH